LNIDLDTCKINNSEKLGEIIDDENEIFVYSLNKRFSFGIKLNEITNNEFLEFLSDKIVPFLSKSDKNGRRFIRFEKIKNPNWRIHPLSWDLIHSNKAIQTPDDISQDFQIFTNSYHLFNWYEDGIFHEQYKFHPVTWVSLYVCIIYCNWKTFKEFGENYQECCYTIGCRQRRDDVKELTPFFTINNDKFGYRLPTIKEWRFASRGADTGNNPYDKYINSNNSKEVEKGQKIKESLREKRTETHDIRKSKQNGYGIYGMLGNVREWATIGDVIDTSGGHIMGGTWALPEESLEYDNEGFFLFPENTNPDVGFRIARSIKLTKKNNKI